MYVYYHVTKQKQPVCISSQEKAIFADTIPYDRMTAIKINREDDDDDATAEVFRLIVYYTYEKCRYYSVTTLNIQ